MKQITLQTAVHLSIHELQATVGSFSAFDVTTLIRKNVDVEYLIPSLTVDYDNAGEVFSVVNHAAVRDIVVELFENGLFDATKSYQTTGNVSYTVYNPIVPALPQVVSTPTPQAVVNPLLDKINTYLTNNGPATIKQIQSALKIKGVTCVDIAKLLDFSRIAILDSSVSKTLVNP